MATYSATDYDKVGVSSHGFAGTCKAKHWEVTCSAAPGTSDTINFGYLPAGARVVLAVLESTDMDTNATPTLALNVGDADDADRLFAASTVGQAGTLSSAIAVAGAGKKYDSKTLITGTASTAAATGAAGTVYLSVFYVVD